uniref:Uncharacterized protein LOC102809495 n=1 Tax=Saccoglossus kowalevskii TaxID=10224 RepID=A0ABM0MJK2_SACKO|nr:PREDICTED: uncharacterized protein LOC102809495 [Saccoglossus kowalevskii]
MAKLQTVYSLLVVLAMFIRAIYLAEPPENAQTSKTKEEIEAKRGFEDVSCTDTCYLSNDGICDDGGEGSQYSYCAYGTDCADCGIRPITLCNNECRYHGDGDCDDGGDGSSYSICELGTDCDDCGPRHL